MRILSKDGYIDAVGLFFELNDEQLELAKNNRDYFMNEALMEDFKNGTGDNAHFIGVCNNGDNSLITKNINLLLKDYKTVSWWDKDMTEFKIRRR